MPPKLSNLPVLHKLLKPSKPPHHPAQHPNYLLLLNTLALPGLAQSGLRLQHLLESADSDVLFKPQRVHFNFKDGVCIMDELPPPTLPTHPHLVFRHLPESAGPDVMFKPQLVEFNCRDGVHFMDKLPPPI